MPNDQLVFVSGEAQHGGSQEHVMRSFGGKYVGEGKANRYRLLVIDLPKAGVLPIPVPYTDYSVQLPGGTAVGSVWQLSSVALTRLDAYFGFSGGYTRSLTGRDLCTVAMISNEGAEVTSDNYAAGQSVTAHIYSLGDTVKAYLTYSGVPRVLLGHGNWFKFKKGVEKTGKKLPIAPPFGEFAGKMGNELAVAVAVGLAGSAVSNVGGETAEPEVVEVVEDFLGF